MTDAQFFSIGLLFMMTWVMLSLIARKLFSLLKELSSIRDNS